VKRIRRLRQLVPTKFATGHRVQAFEITNNAPIMGGEDWRPVFTTWWMWLGRCYRTRHTAI
jgi:hypothetical protein